MSDEHTYYRCRISDELAAGHLLVGRRRIAVKVDEKSIGGFTIRIEDRDLARLKLNKSLILEHQGERSAVHAEWFLNHTSGNVQLGLRRLADLTPPPPQPSAIMELITPRHLLRKFADVPELWLGTAAVLLLMGLTMPGLGDHLGTAPRVRQGSAVLIRTCDEFLRGLFAN